MSTTRIRFVMKRERLREDGGGGGVGRKGWGEVSAWRERGRERALAGDEVHTLSP
jgi:hypothetical protein